MARATSSTPEPAPRPGLRPPRQERTRASLERTLRHAERLLETRFFDDLSVEEFAAAAGVSIGSFYARFPGKEALLDALASRYQENANAFLGSAEFDPALRLTLADRSQRVVSVSVKRYRSRRGLLRGIFTYARLHPEWAGAPAYEVIRGINVRLEKFMLASRAEIRHPRPAQAVRLGLFFVSSTCREKVLFGEAPYAKSIKASDAELTRELSRMFRAYLAG